MMPKVLIRRRVVFLNRSVGRKVKKKKLNKRTEKKIVSLLVFVVIALISAIYGEDLNSIFGGGEVPGPDTALTAKVERVVDGDTIKVKFKEGPQRGTEEKVRLIGVDTPESVHFDSSKNTEAGKAASEFTKKKLEGELVKIETDVRERDKYGRLLAYVYHDGKMFNKTLLEEGYAEVMTIPPNVKYVDQLVKAKKHVE